MQLIEQDLGLLQVAGLEAFGEPAVERSKKIAGLIPPALIAPQPRHAHRGAQFPGLRLLLPRNRERALEILFRSRRIRLRRESCDFPGNAIARGLAPSLLGRFPCGPRFADAARGVIELTDFCVSSC